MSNPNSQQEVSLLSSYGKPLAEYRGEGVLTLETLETVRCTFQAGQMSDGDILLLCELVPEEEPIFVFETEARRFEGTTDAGFLIVVDEISRQTTYLPELPQGRDGTWLAFHLIKLLVQVESGAARRVHFGVTNFRFIGDELAEISRGLYRRVIPLRLENGETVTNITIRPVNDYDRLVSRIITLRATDVTCEIVCDLQNGDVQEYESAASDVCFLLSVARGTKIQWIYRDEYNDVGELLTRTHLARITKPFVALSVIDHRVQGDTKRYIETTYATYSARNELFRLAKGMIEDYLAAKAEGDFLQMRGVKMVVAIEMLKDAFLTLPDVQVNEYILSKNKFNKIASKIRGHLRQLLPSNSIDANQVDAILNKVPELNRTSFGTVLISLLNYINLTVQDEQLRRFVASRNALVHTGRFYCETNNNAERTELVDEWLFLLNFLDQIFLKLVGYSGPYIDWSERGNPTRKELA